MNKKKKKKNFIKQFNILSILFLKIMELNKKEKFLFSIFSQINIFLVN
jgi:hypothetical protein